MSTIKLPPARANGAGYSGCKKTKSKVAWNTSAKDLSQAVAQTSWSKGYSLTCRSGVVYKVTLTGGTYNREAIAELRASQDFTNELHWLIPLTTENEPIMARVVKFLGIDCPSHASAYRTSDVAPIPIYSDSRKAASKKLRQRNRPGKRERDLKKNSIKLY